jgi:DNA-binding NarL/FixJ family response regulator
MSNPIRILIADDHRIVRDGLRLILESQEEFSLAGEAADGEEAVRLAAELHPDVILMDLRMPRMDGIAAIEEIRKRDLKTGIVILTTYNEDDLMIRGLRAGALGFLLKDTDRETLFRVIRSAARGESWTGCCRAPAVPPIAAQAALRRHPPDRENLFRASKKAVLPKAAGLPIVSARC